MRLLLLSACLALLVGCIPVRRTKLSQPVDATAGNVAARASFVSVSTAFLSQRGNGASVVAVTLAARNDGTETTFLDLDRASLALSDPASQLPEITLASRASGSGPAPDAIDLRTPPAPIALAPGELVALWIAFRDDQAFAEPDVPRRIRLRVPVRGASQPIAPGEGIAPGERIELVIAEPATGRPRWVHPPLREGSYAGVTALGRPFQEGSLGVLRASGKNVVGPVVIGPGVDLGFRSGKVRGERERVVLCCDLGLALDASITLWQTRVGSFGPYLTYQSVFALGGGRTDRATWHGPGLGFQFFTNALEPTIAGALPVRSSLTPLGYSSFTVAYVHLFRRGDSGGSPGLLLQFEHTLPEL